MSTNDLMDGFTPVNDESDLTKMLGLLFSKEGIETKSEIRNPPALASLKELANVCKKIGFSRSADTLNHYIETVLEYYVSYDRKGRVEFVDAFKWASTQIAQEKSIGNSLTGNLKDKQL